MGKTSLDEGQSLSILKIGGNDNEKKIKKVRMKFGRDKNKIPLLEGMSVLDVDWSYRVLQSNSKRHKRKLVKTPRNQ